MGKKIYTNEDLEKEKPPISSEPKAWPLIRKAGSAAKTMFSAPTQADMDRLSENAGSFIENNIQPPVKIVEDTGGGLTFPNQGGTPVRTRLTTNWGADTGLNPVVDTKGSNVTAVNAVNNPTTTTTRPVRGFKASEGAGVFPWSKYDNIPEVKMFEEQPAEATAPAPTGLPPMNPAVAKLAIQKRADAGDTFTNEDITKYYGRPEEGKTWHEQLGMDTVAPGQGMVVRTDQPEEAAVPVKGTGLNTGGTDIEALLQKFLAPQQPATTGMSTAGLPSGGLLGSVLKLSYMLNQAKAARQAENQRFWRGMKVADVISNISDRNRRYGLEERKLAADEPYQKAQTEATKASTGLTSKQTAEYLGKREQTQSAREKSAMETAAAQAKIKQEYGDERPIKDIMKEIYDAQMEIWGETEAAKNRPAGAKPTGNTQKGTNKPVWELPNGDLWVDPD